MIKVGRIVKGVEDAIMDVLEKALKEMYDAVPSNLKVEYTMLRDRKRLRVTIFTDTKYAAFVEFGTGDFAKNYLDSQGTPEMVADALKFFETGKGKMPERPYLFPVFNRIKESIARDIDNSVQRYFNSIAWL